MNMEFLDRYKQQNLEPLICRESGTLVGCSPDLKEGIQGQFATCTRTREIIHNLSRRWTALLFGGSELSPLLSIQWGRAIRVLVSPFQTARSRRSGLPVREWHKRLPRPVCVCFVLSIINPLSSTASTTPNTPLTRYGKEPVQRSVVNQTERQRPEGNSLARVRDRAEQRRSKLRARRARWFVSHPKQVLRHYRPLLSTHYNTRPSMGLAATVLTLLPCFAELLPIFRIYNYFF